MTAGDPKISIVVPVYKVEPYLERCVKSILSQTFQEFELILVDDGSPDACPEICDRFAAFDKRIRVFHKENGGLSSARNTGLQMARAPLIGFVDSDDFIAPEMYERLYGRLMEENAEVAVCSFVKVDEEGRLQEGVPKEPFLLEDKVYDGHAFAALRFVQGNGAVIVAWNKLYRKELFSGKEYPVGKWYEDSFLFGELFLSCKRIACTSFCGYYYVQREGGIMHRQGDLRRLDQAESLFYLFEACRKMGMADLLVPVESNMFTYLRDAVAELSPLDRKSTRCREVTGLHGRMVKALRREGLLSVKGLLRAWVFARMGTVYDWWKKLGGTV